MFQELEGLDVWELDGAVCSREDCFDQMRDSGESVRGQPALKS